MTVVLVFPYLMEVVLVILRWFVSCFVCSFVCLFVWLFVSSTVVFVLRDRFERRLQYDCMFGTCELSPIFDIALGILSEL